MAGVRFRAVFGRPHNVRESPINTYGEIGKVQLCPVYTMKLARRAGSMFARSCKRGISETAVCGDRLVGA